MNVDFTFTNVQTLDNSNIRFESDRNVIDST